MRPQNQGKQTRAMCLSKEPSICHPLSPKAPLRSLSGKKEWWMGGEEEVDTKDAEVLHQLGSPLTPSLLPVPWQLPCSAPTGNCKQTLPRQACLPLKIRLKPPHLCPDHHSTSFFFFNWRIIALKNSVVFCQTPTWNSHIHVSPSFWTSLPSPAHSTPLDW